MGMGLSIRRSIIEAHRGLLWATSCEPRVLSFSLRSSLTEPPFLIDVVAPEVCDRTSGVGKS
jgi:signal transduction histidine kinase